MFVKRLISGIVCLALVVAFGIIGGAPMTAFYALIALIGQMELYRAFGINRKGIGVLGIIGAGVFYLSMISNMYLEVKINLMGVTAFTILVLLSAFVMRYPRYKISEIAEAIFGYIYVPVFLSYICTTRNMNGGLYLVWLIFLSSWGTDTCAYCIGKLFGKHKMTPELSPNKSVEGAVGGVVGAALLTFIIYGLIFRERMGFDWVTVLIIVVAVALGSYISMIGDLCASAIKREYKIKDFGSLIPGHGGVLDRMDSVVFTAPIVYFVLQALVLRK